MLNKYLENHLNRHPDELFIKTDYSDFTYQDFAIMISGRAKAFQSVGIMPGNRVGILLDKPLDIIEIIMTCDLLHAIPVLLPSTQTKVELQKIIKNSSPDMIISNWSCTEFLDQLTIPYFPIEELSPVLGGCEPFSYKDFPIEIACILFTTGSTDSPKSVQLTHKNLFESATAWHEQIQFKQNDYYLCCLPMHHIGGLSIFIRALIYGFKIFLSDSSNITTIVNILKDENITLVSLVPTMLDRLLDQTNDLIPNSIRCIIMSGGPALSKLMNRCISHDIPVYKSYGMTETSSGICGFWLLENPSKYDSVGLPFSNTKININDSEIQVKGPTIMAGYFMDEPIKAWFSTGDFGSIDGDGYLFIDMRREDRIVTGGENVNPKEIEQLLTKHPDIKSAKVYGEANEDWGQIVVANIVADINDQEILEWISKKISKFKLPKKFYRE